jgi:hypothetical protein
MDKVILQSVYEPVPKGNGSEGHGEGVEYEDTTYYYRVGKYIPKGKVVSLVHEGNFCGRENGEKDYIIVGYIGDDIVLIDTMPYACGSIRERMKEFKGLSVKECLELIEKERKEKEKEADGLPKCSICGKIALVLESDQGANECGSCYEKRKKGLL